MKKSLIVLGLILLVWYSASSMVQAKVLVNREKAGKNATWTLTDDGVMTVSGKGTVDITSDLSFEYGTQVKKIIVEEGITCIRTLASYYEATEVTLPQSLTKVDVYSLSYNKSLTSLVIPDKVKNISERALFSCKKLKSIHLPKNLKTIGKQAFKKCKSLKSLTIPNGVTSIGQGAFDGCDSLETLVLPKKLQIYKADFSKAKCLRKVVNKSKKWIALDTCDGKRVWKVNGKKVTKLAPGKIATTKGVRYRLTYALSGGKASGKLPKYYYYGKTPKLPKVTKKGKEFLGWYYLQYGGGYIPEKFPEKIGKNVKLTAMLLHLQVKRISETEAKFTVKEKIPWGDINLSIDEKIYAPQYCIRVYTERPTKPYRGLSRDYDAASYLELYRGETGRIGELDPNKKYYYELSFHWKNREADDFVSDGNLCGWHFGYEVPEYKEG